MLRRLWTDKRGVTALVFGISLLVVLGSMGLAVDYGRGFLVRTKLAGAIDAAALAAGRNLDDVNIEGEIQRIFSANFPTGYMGVANVAITHSLSEIDGEKTVVVDGTATLQTTFMGLLGIKTFDVAAKAEVARGGPPMNIAIVVDISGSMNSSSGSSGSRLDAAKVAARTLVEQMFGAAATHANLAISVVPWSTMVNITPPGSVFTGTTTQSVTTFTNPINGETQSEVYIPNNTPVPLLFEPPANWKGCVYARYIDGQPEADQADKEFGPEKFGIMDWMGWEPPGADTGGGSSSSKKKKKKKKIEQEEI